MKIEIQSKNGHKIIDINRRKAIREHCLDCSGWSYQEVNNCSFSDCELHSYRSGKGKQNAKARSNAIRKYCLWCVNGQQTEILKCTSPDCSLFPFRKSKVDRSIAIFGSKPKKDLIRRRRRTDTLRSVPKYRSEVSVLFP